MAMEKSLEQAMAAVVEAGRDRPVDPTQALRMVAVSTTMRRVLDHIAAESLFDTEPAQLATVLEELAGDPDQDP